MEKNMKKPIWGLNSHARLLSWKREHCGSLALCTLLVLSAAASPRPGLASQRLEVKTLSSRPDIVSGGDVLVQITGPAEMPVEMPSVWLNGRDVTTAFHVSPLTHTLIGLVEGLEPGKNRLEVKTDPKVREQLKIINYGITGPIFSGTHQTPFICQTESLGMGPALDADCSGTTEVTYLYKSTRPLPKTDPTVKPNKEQPPPGFKPFDPSGPLPDDIAEVTTSEGKKIKFVVRWERGTINRAIYEIAFLHEPGTPLPDPWTATPGWNRRLVYTFGGGCGAGYHQGHPISSIDERYLSQGYASITSSLNVFGNSCDEIVSAETLAMVKEHFVKRFGVPLHTIGMGGSGGAMQQYLISQNYPGLLDGIVTHDSFPDLITVVPSGVDCSLLERAFEKSIQPWTEEQKTAVSGFSTWETCAKESNGNSWIKSHLSPGWIQPTPCAATIPRTFVYDPVSNPKGVRCDLFDNETNVFGRDPKTGFARRPLDNVGVQYGLVAFNGGKINAEQFLQLNETVGGYDNDGKIVATRTLGNPEALRIAYQTGQVNAGSGGLSSIPIIDIRDYADAVPDLHDEFRSFVTRARLKAANGSADNQVILTFPRAAKPGKKPRTTHDDEMKIVFSLMDLWLDNIAKDRSSRSPLEKIAAAKPDGVVDSCWDEDGEQIVEKRTYDGNGRCNQLYPPHGDPRIAAGEPLTDDILKCALKPVNAKDYLPSLTGDQLARLKRTFSQGVCDYAHPGSGQEPLRGTWRKY